LEDFSTGGTRVTFCIWHDTNVIRPTLQSRLAVRNPANLKYMPSRTKIKNVSVEIPKELQMIYYVNFCFYLEYCFQRVILVIWDALG